MRIHVIDGSRNICIFIPLGLVFNRLTAMIGAAVFKRYALKNRLSAEQINTMFAELRRIRSGHGGWELVDICRRDGRSVKIILD